MNHWRKAIFVGCLLAAILPLVIQSPGHLARKPLASKDAGQLSRTATSTITSGLNQFGDTVITTTNRRFNYVDDSTLSMLLLEEFRSEWIPGIQDKKATVKVDAWTGKYPNPEKKTWSIQSEGDVGEGLYNFYKITRYGCCDSQDTHIWFSMIDGQKVFTSTINPIKVEVPNSDADLIRYVAWHSSGGAIAPEERATMNDLGGVLQYASKRKVSQRVLLRSWGVSEPEQTKLTFRYQGKLYDEKQASGSGLGLWKVNGQNSKAALSDFSIVLTFNNQFEVEIPVENDELQIAKARVPAKLILEVAK